MEEIKFDTIQQVNDHYGITTLHPLVTVVHLAQLLPFELFSKKFCLKISELGLEIV